MLDLFSITTVIARLLALYMLVTATFSIPPVLSYFREVVESGDKLNANSLIFIITSFAYVALALLLLIYAKRFAGFVTRGVDGSGVQISEENFDVLQAVAFSILGAYVLSFAIPNLVKALVLYVIPKSQSESSVFEDYSYPPAMRRVTLEYMAQTLAQFALGVWLLVGSRGITRVVSRAWANGIKAE